MIDVEPHIPHATYRLQLNADLTFTDVAKLVPYFADLGISDLYFSPILTPAPVAATATTLPTTRSSILN